MFFSLFSCWVAVLDTVVVARFLSFLTYVGTTGLVSKSRDLPWRNQRLHRVKVSGSEKQRTPKPEIAVTLQQRTRISEMGGTR